MRRRKICMSDYEYIIHIFIQRALSHYFLCVLQTSSHNKARKTKTSSRKLKLGALKVKVKEHVDIAKKVDGKRIEVKGKNDK